MIERRERRQTFNEEVDCLVILNLSGHLDMRDKLRGLNEAVAQNEREGIGVFHAFVEHFCFEYVMRTGHLMKYRLREKRERVGRGRSSVIRSLVFHG